jgi:PAS domain S-box-containing protein
MRDEDKPKEQLINEINLLRSQLHEKEMLLKSSTTKSEKEQSKRMIFLEVLLNSIPDMIFCKDVEGKYIGCNPVFSQFVGSSIEDIVGKTDYEHFDKELADFFKENDSKMVAQGSPRTNEEWLDFPEGSLLYEMLKAPLYTADGEIMGLIGIGRDITERKKAEEELVKRHEKMLSVFEAINEIIYVSDPNTYELLFVNENVKKDYPEKLIGKKCYNIFQNRDSPCVFCTNDKIFGENIGKSYIWETQNEINKRYYRCIDKAIEWPDGRMVRFEMAIDINESKIAEQALKESEKKFEIISTFAKDAIISINNKGNITFWNSAATNLFGYSHEEVIGQNLHKFIMPEKYRNSHENAFSRFKDTGQGSAINNTLELLARRKDGTELMVELSLSAIKLNNQWNAISIIRDITERKGLEERILQAKIDAENANRTKSEFLANMSHELRTPLNSVIGFSDILLEGYFGELNEKQDKYLNNISNSGKHLLNIINTILDISKIESGTMDLYMDEIVVEDIVNEMVSLMQPLANKKNMKLKVSFMQNFECINADEAKLKQILYNLLGNAIKFTEDGGSVTIKTGNKGDLLTVSVIDTGIGIHSDNFNKLFKPFSQIESHTSRKYEGTGLGLALVKELVNLHGGSIHVESKLQEGSNFIFTLPIGQKKESDRSLN